MNVEDAIELGRRLRERGEAGSPGSLESPEVLEAAAMTALGAIDPARGDAVSLAACVAARDDAESLLVVLGHVGATEAERRLGARLREVDAAMLATRDAWGATAVTPKEPWLLRMAELDPSSWWLDLVSLGVLRDAARAIEPARAFEPANAFRDRPRPAAMKLRARGPEASARLYAEVVGMDDDPARVAVERGAVIARLFEGEVEVLAVGLRADQEDLPPGLCVVRAGGGAGGITAVSLGGVAGGQSPSGWWTPLPSDRTGAIDLVVRFEGPSGAEEESLPLDLAPLDLAR